MPTDINIQTPVNTYNPQERTFIKKPENKVCTTCGQPIFTPVQQMQNTMNKYLNADTGAVIGIINSDAEKIVTKDGTVLVREDLYVYKTKADSVPISVASNNTDSKQPLTANANVKI